MPSGKATKPGDVVTAKNGKTIQVGEHMMKWETVKLLSVIFVCTDDQILL